MGKRTIEDLRQMQAVPLDVKVKMTQRRLREWVNEYGLDGVYVSFSGGKDSTVLLTIARQMYPDIKAVFVDTGLEYPEIRQFVKTWDNVDWLKPKLSFKQVIQKYGYPFISKEVSERVYYAQKYLAWYLSQDNPEKQSSIPSPYGYVDLLGIPRDSNLRKEIYKTKIIPEDILYETAKKGGKGSYKIRELCGLNTRSNGEKSIYDYSNWLWLANSPYMISSKCCDVMKKGPAHAYAKRTGRKSITAQMACESKLRTTQWLKAGCNGFDMKNPISNPMSFWTEQDVLQYIYDNKIPIASVYGDIVIDYNGMDQIEGQMSFNDLDKEYGLFDLNRPLLKTTGCKRTGCMFCGYGCHLERSPGRFEIMKETHPKQYEYIMKPMQEGGLGYKEVIDWLNEHGDLSIKY